MKGYEIRTGDVLLELETHKTCEVLNVTDEYVLVGFESEQGYPMFIYEHESHHWRDYFVILDMSNGYN